METPSGAENVAHKTSNKLSVQTGKSRRMTAFLHCDVVSGARTPCESSFKKLFFKTEDCY